jgi:hypothetical protein
MLIPVFIIIFAIYNYLNIDSKNCNVEWSDETRELIEENGIAFHRYGVLKITSNGRYKLKHATVKIEVSNTFYQRVIIAEETYEMKEGYNSLSYSFVTKEKPTNISFDLLNVTFDRTKDILMTAGFILAGIIIIVKFMIDEINQPDEDEIQN